LLVSLLLTLCCRHTEYYPTGARESQSFGRIVSPGHFDRIKGLIDRSNGTVVFGGSKQCDAETKFIPPTVVSDVTGEDSLMSE
jgi:aldehyde dehydrogenase (NAD+)